MRSFGILTVVLLVAPVEAKATVIYNEQYGMPNFIWTARYLTAGVQVTFETQNLTGTAPDTVLHVLDVNFPRHQVAMNDDCPSGGYRSCATFTPSATAWYYVWVRSYSTTSNGRADLVQNGTTILTQAPFGGVRFLTTWQQNDRFAVTGLSSSYPNDFMLFLLPDNLSFLQLDDDGGANSYAFTHATAAETGTVNGTPRFVAGCYPGSSGTARITQDDSSVDTDLDGISDALENAAQMDPHKTDTDGDGIPDYVEFYGTDGWSMSEDGYRNQPDVYVQLDYLHTTGSNARDPDSSLPWYVQTIFSEDAYGDYGIHAHVYIDNALAWHQFIIADDGLDSETCPPGGDCVKFSDEKAANFVLASRKKYFHYALWGFQHAHDSGGGNFCRSGVASLPGQDVVITLGCSGFTYTTTAQYGTFIHELGHNLNLTHNGNDAPSRAYGTIYQSVMNYNYQFVGIDGSGTGRATYSHGAGGCASCSTSPKQSCLDCADAGTCGSGSCVACDCDVNDWYIVEFNLDFPGEGAGGAGGAGAGVDKWADANHPAVAIEGPTSATEEVAARERASIGNLLSRGLEPGRDFYLAPDGLHAGSSCR